MKVCDSCSMVNRDEDTVCKNCGAPLKEKKVPVQVSAPEKKMTSPGLQKNISSKSALPPSNPTSNKKTSKYLLISVCAALGVLVLCGIIFFVTLKSDVYPTAELSLTAAELAEAYENNSETADHMYKGRVIEVTGILSKRSDRDYYLEGEDTTSRIKCKLSRNGILEVPDDLNLGDVITIVGTVKGKSTDIKMEKCWFVSLVDKTDNPIPDPKKEENGQSVSKENTDAEVTTEKQTQAETETQPVQSETEPQTQPTETEPATNPPVESSTSSPVSEAPTEPSDTQPVVSDGT